MPLPNPAGELQKAILFSPTVITFQSVMPEDLF